MELGEYFLKSFKNMFRGQIYWSAVVLYLLIFLLTASSTSLLVLSMINKLSTSLDPLTIISSLAFEFLMISVILLLLFYLFNVITAFIIFRINSLELGEKPKFFEGFTKSLLSGLKLIVSQTVFILGVSILLLVSTIFALIPVIGEYLALILGLAISLYGITGMYGLISKTVLSGISKGIETGFTLPINKPMLILYTFTLVLVLFLMSMLSTLIGLFTFGAPSIFLLPAISIFGLTISYYYSKE